MYKTIEKLYNGELQPMCTCTNDLNYAKANTEVLKILEQLKKTLSKEQYEQLEKLNEAVEEMNSNEARDMFINRFRPGVQLAVESLR